MSGNPTFDGVPDVHRPRVTKLIEANGKTTSQNPCVVFARKTRPQTKEATENPAGGVEVRQLALEDAEFVNSNWKFRDENSLPRIRDQIRSGFGFGVYVEGEVVSSIMCMK